MASHNARLNPELNHFMIADSKDFAVVYCLIISGFDTKSKTFVGLEWIAFNDRNDRKLCINNEKCLLPCKKVFFE